MTRFLSLVTAVISASYLSNGVYAQSIVRTLFFASSYCLPPFANAVLPDVVRGSLRRQLEHRPDARKQCLYCFTREVLRLDPA